MPSSPRSQAPHFADLGLPTFLLKVLEEVGYETPSPIQAAMIPHVLAGRDVIGQAQTGTGKTAAFALPLLARLDVKRSQPQVLVLTPTRELAIQVAEAFQRYAGHLKKFHVLPIYGGQDYGIQLRQLKRQVHVVVGTPGRVMDHIRRGSLRLDELGSLVLDEADEMLRMGFIDDVEWILAQTPERRQVALFSATMPNSIRKIAQHYLHSPEEITIKEKTTTAKTVQQFFMLVKPVAKLDCLTRIMEAESFDAMLIFVRTKNDTVMLAEKLAARGFAATALNGDIQQNQRTRIVERLKKGTLDVIVATDVAARGLDVPRISHVVNYDIPYDTESYVHRIGRTGRAGKEGKAILFVTQREKRMLTAIEKATGQKITFMNKPSVAMVNESRITGFKERIAETLASEELGLYADLIEEFQEEQGVDALDIAAALAKLVQGDTPLLLNERVKAKEKKAVDQGKPPVPQEAAGQSDEEPEGVEIFRLEVGRSHGVKAGNIVGAIAAEAEIDSRFIGDIDLFDDYSTVELPAGMPDEIFAHLQEVWISGRQLRISRLAKGKKGPGRQRRPKRGIAKRARPSARRRPGRPRNTKR